MDYLHRWLIVAVLAAAALLLIIACTGDDDDDQADDSHDDDDDLGDDDDSVVYPFPEGFLFGSATAGFQVDMGCPTLPAEQCTDPNSDWYRFVTDQQTIDNWRTFLNGEDPAQVGPGHWELYETDLDLAAGELHNNAFRMSIEWSRIFPTSTEGVSGYEDLLAIADGQAIAHYHQVFAALWERGLTPLVTLHHYTMPVWIHDGVTCTVDFNNCTARGWLDSERTVDEITKYAGFVAREFGSEVDLWGTQNEPFAVLLPGFLIPQSTRSNPPCRILDKQGFQTAFEAMVVAHARMYEAVKVNDTMDADNDGASSQVGIIYAVAPFEPIDPGNDLDVQAAQNAFYLWNMVFLNAVTTGRFDGDFDGESEYREDLDGRMDFIGVNYKVIVKVSGLSFPLVPWISPLITFDPLSMDMSEVKPNGLYEMCGYLHGTFGLPIYITENNGQHVPKDDIETEKRYIAENLTWLSLAAENGIDVRGYFYWALMDNYEWNHGTDIRLGLYRVEPDDPGRQRHPRATVELYGSIAEAGGITEDIASQYPVELR